MIRRWLTRRAGQEDRSEAGNHGATNETVAHQWPPCEAKSTNDRTQNTLGEPNRKPGLTL